jgi:hypothetical protein
MIFDIVFSSVRNATLFEKATHKPLGILTGIAADLVGQPRKGKEHNQYAAKKCDQ